MHICQFRSCSRTSLDVVRCTVWDLNLVADTHIPCLYYYNNNNSISLVYYQKQPVYVGTLYTWSLSFHCLLGSQKPSALGGKSFTTLLIHLLSNFLLHPLVLRRACVAHTYDLIFFSPCYHVCSLFVRLLISIWLTSSLATSPCVLCAALALSPRAPYVSPPILLVVLLLLCSM